MRKTGLRRCRRWPRHVEGVQHVPPALLDDRVEPDDATVTLCPYFKLKDAAKFKEMVSALARHVGTQPSIHFSLASKAMSSLSEQTIAAPARPVREYWKDGTHTTKTNNITSDADPPVALEPVKEDWDHSIDMDDYKTKHKIYQENQEAWDKNKVK